MGNAGQTVGGSEYQPHGLRPTRVLVVDDHRTVADAVALAIGREDDLECVATAHGVGEALAYAERFLPDAVVMDVRLSDGDGLDATAKLTHRWPDTRVIVLTAFIDEGLRERAVASGACALLPKDGNLSDLLRALRTARRDDPVIHPSLVKDLVTTPSWEAAQAHSAFTNREQQVLQMLADGSDVVVIARALGISVLTCRGYIKSILMKLNAHTQLEAVVIAHRRGLVHVGGKE